MSKLKSYLMNDVGDGLCVLGKNRRKGLIIDCGGRKSGSRAGKKWMSCLSDGELIDRQDEISLVLTQFQASHFNGFIHQRNRFKEREYLKNSTSKGGGKGLYLDSLFFPGIPEFEGNYRYFSALVAVNLRTLGATCEGPVSDVLTVLMDLYRDPFECYPLFAGDVFAVGDSVFHVHWPPEDLSDSQTASSIQKSMGRFKEALDTDEELKEIFEYVQKQKLYDRYREGTSDQVEGLKNWNPSEEVPDETLESLEHLNRSANRLCLVFSSARDVLFLGDLEKRELNRVISDLETENQLRYKLLIAPDHGTQFSSDMYKIKPEVTLASTGKHLAGNICEEFKQISGRFYSTWVNGDVLVDINREPRVMDDL